MKMKLIQFGISLFILVFSNLAHSQNKGWAIDVVGFPNFYSVKSLDEIDPF